MIEVRDPKTGAKIRWSGHAQAMGFAMPLDAAVNGRGAGRRWAVPEHPDMSVEFDGRIWVASAAWSAIGLHLYGYNKATGALEVFLYQGALSTGEGTIEERQIPTAHRIPQISATANNLYYVCNSTTQGAGPTWYLRRIPQGSTSWLSPTNFTMTTAAHWVGASVPTIAGESVTKGYYYGCRVIRRPSSVERVMIPGCVFSGATSVGHAALLYSDDLYAKGNSETSTWSVTPIILGGTDNAVMGHMAAYSAADGSANMLVGVVTRLYGKDYLNIVYSEDGGATWKVAGVDEVDYEVPSGGIIYTDSEVSDRRIPFLNQENNAFVPQRIIYDHATEKAYVSLVHGETTGGFLSAMPDQDEGSCYILEVDLSARATTGCTQTLHGPFLVSELRGLANGIQLLGLDETTIQAAVAMPRAGTNVHPGYLDLPEGGPQIRVYSIPRATIAQFATWTLVKTIDLPTGGSPYDYEDQINENIVHEWGYGHHQVYNGLAMVDGNPDLIAALAADQRVTGSPQCFHSGRVVILEATP